MAISTGTTYLQFKVKVCNSPSLSFVAVSKEQNAAVDGALCKPIFVLRDCFINLSCVKNICESNFFIIQSYSKLYFNYLEEFGSRHTEMIALHG